MSKTYEVQVPLGDHWPNQGPAPAGRDNSWGRTLLVSIPFLLIGLGSIFATYLPYNSWQVLLGVIALLVLLGALGLAWLKGFPRWSYPYVIPLPGIAILGPSSSDRDHPFFLNFLTESRR